MINQNILKKCELCQIEATSLCQECFIYYCDECYKYIHSKKEKTNHKKDKIDYFSPIDTKCPIHPSIPINLFCIDEEGNK